MTTRLDREDYLAWAEAVLNEGVNLTDWERQFVESVHRQLERHHVLSDKQAEILERIYAKVTP